MSEFPRTMVGGVSLPRMIIGTNWFCGYSHQSCAKDKHIRSYQDAQKIADVLEVYLEYGIDAIMGWHLMNPTLVEGIREAEQRKGRKIIVIDTPAMAFHPDGSINWSETHWIMDKSVEFGATFCMPHQSTTDALIDRTTRKIRDMDNLALMMRERGLVPGLSTHMPESVIFADESGLDVETYIQIFNAAGFLMQVEVDWVHGIILNAAKPVMTIKPMAAGRLQPLVGLAFVWATLRDQDMVTVGAMTPDEAREDIEISLSILERRAPKVELQKTRSKKHVQKQTPATAQ